MDRAVARKLSSDVIRVDDHLECVTRAGISAEKKSRGQSLLDDPRQRAAQADRLQRLTDGAADPRASRDALPLRQIFLVRSERDVGLITQRAFNGLPVCTIFEREHVDVVVAARERGPYGRERGQNSHSASRTFDL